LGALKIEKTKECHFVSKFLVQGTTRREKDMDSAFVLCCSKSAHFSSPRNLCQAHFKRWA
jgi:hypothetical protein